MKRFLTFLAMMMIIITSAAAMSFSKARKEAYFLTDKMAYELALSTSQMDAVYEINLDYLLALGAPDDLEGIYWMRRNSDLRYVLSPWQWSLYTQIVDFYRPMYWVSGSRFALYLRSRYTSRHHYYYDRPSIYGSYRGGHNTGYGSFYAGRNYGAPMAPPSTPSYTHINGTGRMGGNGATNGRANGNPPVNGAGHAGYSIGNSANPNIPGTSRGTMNNEGRSANFSTSSPVRQNSSSTGSVRGRSAGTTSNVSTSGRPAATTTRSTTTTTTTTTSSSRSSAGTTSRSSTGTTTARSNSGSSHGGSQRGGR